jgi:hypothetical protein
VTKVRTWVGLDVHAAKVLACVVDACSGEMTVHRLPGEAAGVVSFCVGLSAPTRVAYEAGPTGFGLARALRRRRVEGRRQRCPEAAIWSVRPRVVVAAPEGEPGRSAMENGPDSRPAAVTFATGERYVIRLILRICLSKIRAVTRRRSMLTRPAPEPAVYRSFRFGSVAAATITLAIVAGSFGRLTDPRRCSCHKRYPS